MGSFDFLGGSGPEKALKLKSKVTQKYGDPLVRQKAMALSVDAVTVLEKMLKLGDSKEQMEAAREILDMTGQRKRDSGGASGPVIMLMGAAGSVPWAQRIEVKNGGSVPKTIGSIEVPSAQSAQRSEGEHVPEGSVHGGLPSGEPSGVGG